MMRFNVVFLPFFLIFSAAGATATDTASPSDLPGPDPLTVLLLDYHDPHEHDVLLSHLCVERCTSGNDCPEAWIKQGVDYFSNDFIVYRPGYLGKDARFVVDIYKDREIDLLSFSGHHASGFSGERGRGRFDTELLGRDMPGIDGAADFFTRPTLVMLQGCRTDVNAEFAGDPMEYVLHVIHDTQVRENDFERLMAAVQQIGGVQEAYRDLFPNACILGYEGTQSPGGRLEIYGQVHSWLRGLASVGASIEDITPSKFELQEAFSSRSLLESMNREIERECRRGWPCNLCATDQATYKPLKDALIRWLRTQHKRAHENRHVMTNSQRQALERSFDNTSFYANSSWSCDVRPPLTAPIWPDPVDESPFGRLFVELLLLEIETWTPAQKRELRGELAHRLGSITFAEIDQIELRAWLHGEPTWARFWDFVRRPLLDLSTFRQRDLFSFLAAIECKDCFVRIFEEPLPAILRENAASQLRPSLGSQIYRLALNDPHPRVRLLAAERLDASLGDDLLHSARQHDDPEVRRAANERLADPMNNPNMASGGL